MPRREGRERRAGTPRRLRRTEQPAEDRGARPVRVPRRLPKRPPATRRAEARRGRNDHREITRHTSATRTEPPPATQAAHIQTLTTWLSATVRLVSDWPALPVPGELVRLALPCPPQLVELTGYDGPGRLVALWWSPFGDELMFSDGTLTATGHWRGWCCFCEHPLVRMFLDPYELGDSEDEGEHRLLSTAASARSMSGSLAMSSSCSQPSPRGFTR